MDGTTFTKGQAIWWYDSPRQGYGSFRPVKAVFVEYNQGGKTAKIDAILAHGGTVQKQRIKVEKLQARETE